LDLVDRELLQPPAFGLRLAAVRDAQHAEIDVRSLADLGLRPAAVESGLTSIDRRERADEVTVLDGPTEATRLAAVLRANGARQ